MQITKRIINQLSLEDGILTLVQNKEKTLEAKLKESQKWKSENVYKEIPDQGQDCISLRWLIKEILVDNEKAIKTRLCARDFEEEQNSRTDSLMCSRESLRLAFPMIASKK